MKSRQKLELAWIGKENRPKLEPRILVEDPSKSCHAQGKTTASINGSASSPPIKTLELQYDEKRRAGWTNRGRNGLVANFKGKLTPHAELCTLRWRLS